MLTAWHGIECIEKIQKPFVRLIGSSAMPKKYTDRCLLFGLESLQNRRSDACASFALFSLGGKVQCTELSKFVKPCEQAFQLRYKAKDFKDLELKTFYKVLINN